MANTIKIKAGSGTPTTSNIVDRELAFDRSANKLYINDNGSIVDLSGEVGDITAVTAGTGLDGGGSSGDVSLSVDVSDFMANGSNDRILTATGTDAMNAEANLTFDGSSNLNLLSDSGRLRLGASNDIQIAHDGTSSFISNYTGHLYINQWADDSDIILRSDDGAGGITAYLTLDGSAGFTKANKQIKFLDNVKGIFGDSSDLEIYHDGTNSVINNTTGDLQIYNNLDDKDIVFLTDDGSGGTTPYITLDGGDARIYADKDIRIRQDNTYLTLGASGSDMYMYHDGTNSWIRNNTGHLYIRNDSDGSDIYFGTNDDVGTLNYTMAIDGTNNRVGMGTTSPAQPLDVNGRIRATSLEISDGNAIMYRNSGDFELITYGGYDIDLNPAGDVRIDGASLKFNNNSEYIYFKDASGTSFRGMGINSINNFYVGPIDSFAGGFMLYGASANTSGHVWYSGNAEAMRIDSSQRVGIGSQSPDSKLQVEYTTTSNGSAAIAEFGTSGSGAIAGSAHQVIVGGPSVSDYTGIQIFSDTTTGKGVLSFADGRGANDNWRGVIQYDHSANDMEFWTDAAERMKINSSGNVGIGTQSPGNKFTVNSTSAYQASIQYDASTRLRISVEGSGKARLYTDNSANVGIESGGLYIQPTNKFYLDGGLDTYIKESSANVMEFYCADSRRMQLTTTYLQVPDNAYLAAGNDNDIFIRHDGNGHLQSNAGTMFINQVSNNSMIFSTSNTERIRINGNGNIGIANISPYEKLDVKSASSTSPAIVANGASANGSFNMAHGYDGANGDYVCTYSTQYSTVGMVLGYGVKASTTASDTFLCSADNSNFTRGAVVLTDTLKFWTAGAQTGTLNNNITMTERFRVTPAGVGHFDNDVVAYSSTVSDKRLKENITTIDNALDKVMALRGVEYDWTATSRKGTHDIGLVAQEVEEVLPELVTEHELCTGEFGGEGNEKTFKTVNYDKMVGVLIEAIKEQQQQINELKIKLEEKSNG
jgi:hypothetical protein